MGEVNGVNGSSKVVVNGKSSWQSKHDLPSHFIGGNKLGNAPPSSVKEFVENSDGHSVITSVSFSDFVFKSWH